MCARAFTVVASWLYPQLVSLPVVVTGEILFH